MTKLQTYWKTLTSDKKQELADSVNMSKGGLSNVFNGVRPPSLPLVSRLLKADKAIKFMWFINDNVK